MRHPRKSSKSPRLTTSDRSPLPVGASSLEQNATQASPLISIGRSWRTHSLLAVILTLAVAALYCWTVDFPLVFDDLIYLRNNPLLTDSKSFGFATRFVEFANHPSSIGLDPDLATNFVLRPVAYLTFHINYVFGGFNPRWYRAFNILAHLANAGLICLLLRQLLNRNSGAASQHRISITFIASAAAFWFAVHPLATESVTFVVQRFTSLATTFYLLTLLLYFKAQSTRDPALRWTLTGAATFSMLLGMLTKESCFTAPLMAVILDWLVAGTRLRKTLLRALPLLMLMPLIPSLLLLVSWAQNNGSLTFDATINLVNLKDAPASPWHYAITQITVVVGYLRLLLWPAGLNVDHDWPLHRSLLEPAVLGAAGIILVLIAGSFWFMRQQRHDPRASLIFVSVLWYFITIAISSSFVPLPDLMSEHRSYLPSVGFFMGIACLVDWLQSRPLFQREVRLVAPVAAAVIAAGLFAATLQRNEVWRSRISLWENAVARSPNKHRVWGNLGSSYAEAGRLKDSEQCYLRAKEADPSFLPAYINLGTLALAQNECQKALEVSREAARIIPKAGNTVDIRYNVAVALLGIGRLDEGAQMLLEIISHIPGHRDSHYALGKYYWHQKRYARALDHWRRASMLSADKEDLPQLITMAEATVGH